MNRLLTLQHLRNSPLGPVAIAGTDAGLLAVEIGVTDLAAWAGQWTAGGAQISPGPAPFPALLQFEEYFAGHRKVFDLPLDLSGQRAFRRAVLGAVAAIPFGETRTYGQVAAALGRPGAARAVGGANAANPLAIVIPCHRLVGSDGSLRGYAAPDGVRAKAWLLEHERRFR